MRLKYALSTLAGLMLASCAVSTHAASQSIVIDDLTHQVDIGMTDCPTTTSTGQSGVTGLATQIATRDFEGECFGSGSVTAEIAGGQLTILPTGASWGVFVGYGIDQNVWMDRVQLQIDAPSMVSVEIYKNFSLIGGGSSLASNAISLELNFGAPVQFLGGETLGMWIRSTNQAVISNFVATKVDEPVSVVSEPATWAMSLLGLGLILYRRTAMPRTQA